MAALFMAMRVEPELGGLLYLDVCCCLAAHMYVFLEGRQYIGILGVLGFLRHAAPLRPGEYSSMRRAFAMVLALTCFVGKKGRCERDENAR